MEEKNQGSSVLGNEIILEDKEDEYQAHNETLRIGKFLCVNLNIFFPYRFKGWFYSEANESGSKDFLLQVGNALEGFFR